MSSVVRVEETHIGTSLEDGIDTARYARAWMVMVDEPDPLAAIIVRNAVEAIAPRGSPYDYDPRAILRRYSAAYRADSSRLAFLVCAYYEYDRNAKPDSELAPWFQRPLLSAQSIANQKVATVDADGKALCLPTGDPFNPPPQVDTYNTKYVLQVNVRNFDWLSWKSLIGKVNANEISLKSITVPAGQARMLGIMPSEQLYENEVYCAVRFEIEVTEDPDGFKDKIPYFSYYALKTANDKSSKYRLTTKDIHDKERPSANPLPLKEDGTLAADGEAHVAKFELEAPVQWPALPMGGWIG